MMMKKSLKSEKEGLSLRRANRLMIAVSTLISLVLLIATFTSSSMSKRISKANENYVIWQEDAYQLMAASDYLTQEVQSYTVTLKKEHLDNYFIEAQQNKRREKAIENVPEKEKNSQAYQDLLNAMNSSLELMNKEYYAMALVCKALDVNIVDYPIEIQNTIILKEDLSLSKDEMINKAQELVHNNEYYAKKDEIRKNMNESVEQIKTSTDIAQLESNKSLNNLLGIIRLLIIIQSIGIVIMFVLTSKLGILPILKGVEKIDEDSPIPEIGAQEFRYLARSYNKMYDTYKESIAHLNYDVSHDALTGLYNREGYEILKDSIDLKNTTMIVIDVDDFKNINDTYGHETGDKILQKIARVLLNNFRNEDYVCRIGGDEFVTFMLHSKPDCEKLIGRKVESINKALANVSDGLPSVSVSVGAASGKKYKNQEELFKHADEALYRAKSGGKKGWAFYKF